MASSNTKSSQNAPKTANKIKLCPLYDYVLEYSINFAPAMKKIIVILLAFQILSGNVLLSELAKVPQLMQHFHQHQRENNTIDFLSFLKMHYADPEHQRKDASRHGSLPLKTVTSAHAEIVVLSETTPSVFLAEKAVIFENPILPATENLFFDSKIPFSIFQPPRV